MNKNTKNRTALLRRHIKQDMRKSGTSFQAAQTALLSANSARVMDDRPGHRDGTTSYRYAGV